MRAVPGRRAARWRGPRRQRRESRPSWEASNRLRLPQWPTAEGGRLVARAKVLSGIKRSSRAVAKLAPVTHDPTIGRCDGAVSCMPQQRCATFALSAWGTCASRASVALPLQDVHDALLGRQSENPHTYRRVRRRCLGRHPRYHRGGPDSTASSVDVGNHSRGRAEPVDSRRVAVARLAPRATGVVSSTPRIAFARRAEISGLEAAIPLTARKGAYVHREYRAA